MSPLYDSRVRPHMIRPAAPDGNIVAAGTYGLAVTAGGQVDGLTEVGSLPAGGSIAETLAKVSGTDYDVAWITSSVVTILLPAGSDASDVPADAPIPCIVRIKA